MENQIQTVENITRIEWSNQPVLMTAQLAEFYGTTAENLRVRNSYVQISPMTRALYLWTKRGAARHAKMLNTDKAWEVFEELEDNYFNRPAVADNQFVVLERERLNLEREQFNLANSEESKTIAKVQLIRELASASKDDDIRNKLVLHAAKLLIGEDFVFDEEEFLTPCLRTRLDKNRQYLLDNPHELKKYLLSEKAMSAEELLARISLESKFFQGAMDEFQREELSYLENPLEF